MIDPRAIGKMLQLADVKENDTVLDVGCATGYSTALLAQLALNVVAVESDAGLRAQAANNFASLGLVSNARACRGTAARRFYASRRALRCHLRRRRD